MSSAPLAYFLAAEETAPSAAPLTTLEPTIMNRSPDFFKNCQQACHRSQGQEHDDGDQSEREENYTKPKVENRGVEFSFSLLLAAIFVEDFRVSHDCW